MKYAWIENGVICDIAWATPDEIYHSDVAKFYNTQVPDNAKTGDNWVNGVLTTPERVTFYAPPARQWTANDFRVGMTLGEKSKWDSDSKPEIVTAKLELAAPKELADATELLDFLIAATVISAATKAKILA